MENTYKVNGEAVKKIAERVYDNGSTVINRNDLEEIFPELKGLENKEKPNGGIVLEDFNEGDGFYKVNLAYLNKEQVEEIENIVKKWNPEIKESGDERIELLNYLYNVHDDDEERARWITWLEKQGEQKPIEPTDLKTWKYIVDAVLTEREGIGQYIDSHWTTDVAKKLQKRFGNIEQNPVNTSISFDTVTGVLRFDNLTLEQAEATRKALFGKEKPVEWSEDDEAFLEDIICKVESDLTLNKDEKNWLKSLRSKPKQKLSEEDEKMFERCLQLVCESDYNLSDKVDLEFWLKSIRPQLRQEWSEEDEKMYAATIFALAGFMGNEDKLNWLNALKDRYTWKPSEEQMVALDGICSYIRNKADWEISQDMVSDLYKLSEQLKKLREK